MESDNSVRKYRLFGFLSYGYLNISLREGVVLVGVGLAVVDADVEDPLSALSLL